MSDPPRPIDDEAESSVEPTEAEDASSEIAGERIADNETDADETTTADASEKSSETADAGDTVTAQAGETNASETADASQAAAQDVGENVANANASETATASVVRRTSPRASLGREPMRESTDRSLRVGAPALVTALWATFHWVVPIGIAIPFFVMVAGSGEEPPFHAPGSVFGVDALVGFFLAGWALWRGGKIASGTPGRGRLFWLSAGTLTRSLGYALLAVTLTIFLTAPNALSVGLLEGESFMGIGQPNLYAEQLQLTTVAQGTWPLVVTGVVLIVLGGVIELIGIIACWFLIPLRVRRWFWFAFDVLLLLAFVVVTLLFPITVTEGGGLLDPSIRLFVTALFVVRMLVWITPFVLDVIEGTFRTGIPPLGNFRLLIAARMMRAKKSGFVTVIGALSILAVSFSSCMLTSTLSVMGGFRNDLKRKILGNNAHVLVDRESGTFEGWLPILETVRAQDEVVAATPYVQGEVMITSATNLGGAVIRGIDPETIVDVTELRRNMRHGRIEYLSDPERLLRLAPAEMGRGLLAPSLGLDPQGSIFEDVEAVIAEAAAEEAAAAEGAARAADAGTDAGDPELARIRDEIDEFLLPEGEHTGEAFAEADDRPPAGDVLPGLIVGQELARTLRLHVGDEVNVVSPLGDLGPTGPIPKSRPFRIAGIFYSGMYEFDMKMAYATLEAAQGFLGVGEAISGIEVKVEDTDRAMGVAAAIESAIDQPSLRVRAWQVVNRNLFGALQLEKLAMFITLGIAVLVASFCIVGTLFLMVQEKRKQVGILKAMGATGEQVVAIFMAQGLMIGLLGAGIGLGLGYLTTFLMENFGIHLNPDVYYIDKLPVHIDPTEFAVTGIATVIVCLLATIYPAIIGSRLTPLDALRD